MPTPVIRVTVTIRDTGSWTASDLGGAHIDVPIHGPDTVLALAGRAAEEARDLAATLLGSRSVSKAVYDLLRPEGDSKPLVPEVEVTPDLPEEMI